ncbi:MAG: aminopeptidase P family protein [Planctomycetia bacterium]|nr:aminopeptidase P family protein [Planctomycetia bacterium]
MASLEKESCRLRQARFRERLRSRSIDAAVVSDSRDIYYFTGVLVPPRLPACLLVETEGRSWLFAPSDRGEPAADECLTYEWEQLGTFNTDFINQLGIVLGGTLKHAFQSNRLGWQTESLPHQLARALEGALCPDHWHAIDAELLEMQQRKDPDELAVIRQSVRVNLAAYDAAQATIRPDANELEVLAAATGGAILEAGEKVFHDGDYRSGRLNGPARNRAIERGELYIIDAWTCYRGYWSDLSRTFIVGGEPSDLQRSLFDYVAAVLTDAAAMLKPGAEGRDIWRQLDQLLREHPTLAASGLVHHAGHAIGLRTHEMPDINRDRGGMLEPGMVICIEPGGYVDEARYGVRLENMYLITESGAENLSEYPVQLLPRVQQARAGSSAD